MGGPAYFRVSEKHLYISDLVPTLRCRVKPAGILRYLVCYSQAAIKG